MMHGPMNVKFFTTYINAEPSAFCHICPPIICLSGIMSIRHWGKKKGVTPPILDLGERREWSVNTLRWSFYGRERAPVPTLEEDKGNNTIVKILTIVKVKWLCFNVC